MLDIITRLLGVTVEQWMLSINQRQRWGWVGCVGVCL